MTEGQQIEHGPDEVSASAEPRSPPTHGVVGQNQAEKPSGNAFPGPYIHVAPLTPEYLPVGRKTAEFNGISGAGEPDILKFIQKVCTEGLHIVEEIQHWEEIKTYNYSTVDAPVRCYKTTLDNSVILNSRAIHDAQTARDWSPYLKRQSETWFARRSVHHDPGVVTGGAGTATWSEFEKYLLRDHSENEKEYTGSVYDCKVLIDYAEDLQEEISRRLSHQPPNQIDYRDMTMRIIEMGHEIGWPIRNRVFPVLVITSRPGPDEFVVVQIPLHIVDQPWAFYSNGRNRRQGNFEKVQREKVVVGSYCSVEHCKREQSEDKKSHTITWTMATSSNAQGSLKQLTGLQNMAMPGKIAPDVKYVLEWVAKERQTGAGGSPGIPTSR